MGMQVPDQPRGLDAASRLSCSDTAGFGAISFEVSLPWTKPSRPHTLSMFEIAFSLSLTMTELSIKLGFCSHPCSPFIAWQVSKGKQVRRNGNVVWLAHEALCAHVWRRVAAHMPTDGCGGGVPVGLNRRWRLYRCAEEE